MKKESDKFVFLFNHGVYETRNHNSLDRLTIYRKRRETDFEKFQKHSIIF